MATSSVSSSTSSGGISISGLGSGLDINGIVDSLMQIEAKTQTKLKSSLSKHQTMVTAYQSLNSAFSAIKTASQDLSLGTNWKAKSVTSSNTNVTATASNSAATGSLSFTVQNLASAHSMVTSGSVNSLNTDLGTGKTLQQTIDAINADSTKNYTAGAVQISPGVYKMQLQAKQTGTANAITDNVNAMAGSMGTFGSTQDAANATIKIGSNANAYTVSSASNTVTDVLPGITLNLVKADPSVPITVTVGGDADSLADKVEAMVNSVNSAINLIQNNAKYDPATKSGGVLLGNATTNNLLTQLHNAIADIVAGSSVKLGSSAGLDSKADGTFTFDKTKFKTAFAANPEGVAAAFVQGGTTSVTDGTKPGIAERLKKVAQSATDSVTGYLTTAIKGENTTIERLNKSITDWDDRLEKKRTTLKAMYSAMDTAMSKFSNQSSWLAGQISSLSS